MSTPPDLGCVCLYGSSGGKTTATTSSVYLIEKEIESYFLCSDSSIYVTAHSYNFLPHTFMLEEYKK